MESDNPLDPIWKVYEVTKDCLKVTQRTVNRSDECLLRETEFIGNSAQQSMEWITKSRSESDNFIIMSLWASFERTIISYLQEKGRKILEAQPISFSQVLYNKFEKEVEYWRIEDVLNLFKQNIDSRLIGDAKNIKRHRDWIAHRNPNRRSPGKVTPIFAYRILSKILAQIPE
ncbi:hypothetical protein KA005_02405 [bacterium]|nr:hypothetical protein [bacterium]